ncbi:MAG: septum formation initiator family protein [Mariprofundaceae bacterium]|nr:septum formation initiator family protein [Mariprofundaceae bacterium]
MSLALLVYMAWDLIASDHGYLVYRREHAEVLSLQQQLQQMQQKREMLAAQILSLRKDPKALEELVHRELGYVHPDEYMLIVPQDMQDTDDKRTTK